jgi:hypothetical protein
MHISPAFPTYFREAISLYYSDSDVEQPYLLLGEVAHGI